MAALRQQGMAKQLAAAVLLVILYFWIMRVAVLSILRYMIPVTGLLFALVPALVAAGQKYRSARGLSTDTALGK
jgi:hypothetical protein